MFRSKWREPQDDLKENKQVMIFLFVIFQKMKEKSADFSVSKRGTEKQNKV